MYGKRDKKDDEEAFGGNPFAKLQKSSALQEARVFNETPVNPRKCALTLTKILYLLNQGEVLSVQEATDAFFNMTRLFQCKDATLRRLLYLGIKELSTIAENVYVVTSSLTSDMNAKVDMCRPQALRTLCMITDATVFPGIERYMKQAIVDKNAAVASAALVSALHLARVVPEGVKRWVNEAQEAVNSEHTMVQHHALGLLYHIRKNDRLAVTKLVTKYINSGLKSNFAVCMLIRIAANLIEDEQTGSNSPYFDFIESCLRHKSEMVVYEAANAIVNLSCTTQKELMPAVSVLQLFLSSQKATLRFAAVRTLNKIAMTQPNAVMSCNVDLEILINDSNRSIATLAITTLLKTGHEGSVERLIKLITTFMSEISDEFKIIVVRATRQLCQKFPKKHNTMMHFLSNMLREEGGFEYKRCLVETIIDIIEDIPEAKEEGLSYLCEFIEDCEPVEIAIKILHLLGKEGPFTSRPSKYIRYVYNRLILETAAIRSAAVSALAKFGAHCDDLLPNIIVLLERSCLDTDDEVRDRATYYLNILKQREKELMGKCILNPFAFSISGLERALVAYLESNQQDKPFDLQSVPYEKAPNKQEQNVPLPAGSLSSGLGNFSQISANNSVVKSANEKVTPARHNEIVEKLSAIDSIAELELGPLIKSSPPIELTESETEYVIHCIKHVFANHVVFQFDCTNTLNDQLLENVSIMLQVPSGFTEVVTVPCSSLAYNVTGTIYNVFEYTSDDYSSMVGTFESVLLKFTVKDCDPITGQLLDEDDQGYSDEYLLEDVDMSVADYIQRLIKNDFDHTWSELGDESEVEEVFALSAFKTIEEAIKNVICFMGMQPCDRTDRLVDSKNAFHHTLKLVGLFLAQTEVLVIAKLAVNINQPEAGVTMKLQVRCENQEISNFIASAVV